MKDTRSPIERMIDEACGVPKDFKITPGIMLHCPKCGKYGTTTRQKDDPPDLNCIEVECPDCA